MRSRDELKWARDERRGSKGDVSLSAVMCLEGGRENGCRHVPKREIIRSHTPEGRGGEGKGESERDSEGSVDEGEGVRERGKRKEEGRRLAG